MARSAAKRFIGTLLFVFAFFAVVGFAFLLFAEANNVDSVPGTDNIPNLGLIVAICLGAVAVLLILLFIIRRYDRKTEEAEGAEAFFVPDSDREAMEGEAGAAFDQAFEDTTFHEVPDMTVYDLEDLAIEQQAWDDASEDEKGPIHGFRFPRDAPDAVFTHDYIPIGGGARLKLRTLMAGPAELPSLTEQPKGAEKADEPVADADDLKEMLAERERKMVESGELDEGYEGLMSEDEKGATQEAPVEAAPMKAEVFYHFPGDAQDLSKMESIGDAYAEKLAQHGIKTTHRLAFAETAEVAAETGIDAELIDAWKAEADLSLVTGIGPATAALLAGAGITLDDLKKKAASTLHKTAAAAMDDAPSETKFDAWKEAAKSLRRRRMEVPAV